MKYDQNKKAQVDLWKVFQRFGFGISQPLIEVVYGIRKETIPLGPMIAWGLFFDYLVLSKWDQKLFHWINLDWLYPRNPILFSVYITCGVFLGFWLWGAVQTQRKIKMITRLTDVFQECGLKSPMGRLPSFIFDKPVCRRRSELGPNPTIWRSHGPQSKIIAKGTTLVLWSIYFV